MLAGKRQNLLGHQSEASDTRYSRTRQPLPDPKGRRRIFRLRTISIIGGLVLAAAAVGGWLLYRALEIRSEVESVTSLVSEFKYSLLAHDDAAARLTLAQLQDHIGRARSAATDPLWKAAGSVPGVGANFSVVSELVLSADDVVNGAAQPLLSAYSSLDWKSLKPVEGKFDVSALAASSPSIVAAANTVDLTYTRLAGIEGEGLLPAVALPLADVRNTLHDLRRSLNTAADTSRILPNMMGTAGARNYLVLIQNNAEIRATGGLPGALAVLRVEDGTVSLAAQSSGAALGKFSPPVDVDSAQSTIYSKRLGAYISDVNLTPDFPTAAKTAKSMWETRHGTPIDGVIALDPVVLAHILKASGPVSIPSVDPELDSRLPRVLDGGNVVKVLLSDVYSSARTNELQDAYFASVSKAIFSLLSSGKVQSDLLLSAFTKSAEEHRLLVWSGYPDEQDVLQNTPVGGSISGPAVGGASFGVYFNDGTGAKMDYHVRRTVQLIGTCTTGDYTDYKVKVTLANTAPPDAATSLPKAVTGGGSFGTPAGSIQTNVVVYGPALSHLDTALQDKGQVAFGSYLHKDRPVGVVTTRLAAGESTELELTFGRVVQKTDPVVVVTPTVQEVNDVLMRTERSDCSTAIK